MEDSLGGADGGGSCSMMAGLGPCVGGEVTGCVVDSSSGIVCVALWDIGVVLPIPPLSLSVTLSRDDSLIAEVAARSKIICAMASPL